MTLVREFVRRQDIAKFYKDYRMIKFFSCVYSCGVFFYVWTIAFAKYRFPRARTIPRHVLSYRDARTISDIKEASIVKIDTSLNLIKLCETVKKGNLLGGSCALRC